MDPIVDRNPGLQGSFGNTITFAEATDLVRRMWVKENEHPVRNAAQLFITENIGSGNGGTKRFNEVDSDTFSDEKAEGANSKKAKSGIGYHKDLIVSTYSKEIDITIEMRTLAKDAEIVAAITNLVGFCERRIDLDLTHRFTFANATSYVNMNGTTVDTTVGDNLALLSAVHTLAFSSTTYTNIVPGNPIFSQGAFEAAKLLTTTEIMNNFGDKRTKNFNTIVTGEDPATVRTVKQLLQSTADVDAAQSGVTNVYQGAMRHVVLPYLATTATGANDATKRRWWFLVASGQGVMGFQAYLGIWMAPTYRTPSAGNNGEDINNYNWTYSTLDMHGIAIVSPKGCIGSCPTN